MGKAFEGIIRHKIIVLITFLILTIACVFLSKGVNVNYNFFDYLPDDSQSTIALEVMNHEFSGGIPNTQVMVKNITIPEALDIKDKILSINGVLDVTWLDNNVNIYAPLEMANLKIVEKYYKDNNALFLVAMDKELEMEVLNNIRTTIKNTGKEVVMAGSTVNTATATESSGSEVVKITRFLVPLCFIILLLTTNSLFEPVLFMITIGIAILLNRGTNIIFGEISFVTNAAGSILQLAVSMDYSIFLLHRFSDYRKEGLNVQDAMLSALKNVFSTITSSGLTTVIGFAALILMRFKIGPDMGWVMGKAILLSMISVLILLPVLTLIFYKLIDKTQHRSLMPNFKWLSKLITKIRIPATLLFIIAIVPAFLAQQSNDFYYGASYIFGEGTTLYEEKTEIENTFGKANQVVILLPKGDFAKEIKLSNDLRAIPQVINIISYVDNVGAEIPVEYIDKNLVSKLISENYSRMIVSVTTDYEGTEAFYVVDEIKDLISKYYNDNYYIAGDSVNTYGLKEVVEVDMVKVNLIAIMAVFVVLLFTMKSILLPLILVLVIETSIWINLCIPYFSDLTIFYIAYLIISSIQLGATVDYAILLTTKYLEERTKDSKKVAIINTLSQTTLSILTSGGILMLGGLVLGMISTNGVLSQLGTFIGRGAILSVVLVLFVLPALLYFLDKPIQKTTIGINFFNGGN